MSRPWHLWVVALLMFGLYVGGARDFVLINGGDTEYVVSQFGEGGLQYFSDYPWGYRVLWATNILAGLSAPVALLASKTWGFRLGVVALVAQTILFALTLIFRSRWSALGSSIGIADLVITAPTALFVLYAARLRKSCRVTRREGERNTADPMR